MNWSLVAPVNDEMLYENCLLKSPDISAARRVIRQKGFVTAGIAFNQAISTLDSDYIVIAHQDLYLPSGWLNCLTKTIAWLERNDKKWGVLGLFGASYNGESLGYVYSTGLKRYIGQPFSQPTMVRVLDEILLVINGSSGLKFDEHLSGFHLYATDLCLQAENRGMRNYVAPCFALHNSRGISMLPMSFWKAYIYLRRKWHSRLPVTTPCTIITTWCTPFIKHFLTTGWSSIYSSKKPGNRVDDPERFYSEYIVPTVQSDSRKAL